MQRQVERMEANWDTLRDKILQQDFTRIKELVESSLAAAEEALGKADLFMCQQMTHRQQKRRSGRGRRMPIP